jgi:glyoxylase-like metal-dependent hydrolase (beta-lactamase superfamily II)
VEAHFPGGTVSRLWALPGATLRGREPELNNGTIRLGARPVVSPCPSYLIEHPRGLVLFDTGVNPKGFEDPVSFFGDIARQWQLETRPELAVDAQIRAVGFRREDVRYVVPSHLHYDHAGGVHLFAGSTIIVGAGELRYAYWPPPSQRRAFLIEDLLPTRAFDWVELGADQDLFGDGSVVVLYTPGHTPGELSLLVRLPSRVMLLTGDTCHFCLELEHGMPAADIPCSDAHLAAQSIRRIRLLRDSLPAEVWIGHDPVHWATYPHAPESLT